ncbi:MAG: nodulation protein NfeD [Anaerolineales bacterium]
MGKVRSLFLMVLIVLSVCGVALAQGERDILVLQAKGPIMPPMLEYFRRAIQVAEREGAQLVLIELDTPGGSLDATSEIIQVFRASEVPVVIYISPNGAMAGSAGALISMAAHRIAMAPETSIGAATPVSGSGEELDETMQKKAKEITKASIRPLVEKRGEKALALAESMIEEARAVSAGEALEAGLIDFIATDRADLLRQLDGQVIEIGSTQRTLQTAGAPLRPFEMSLIERLLLTLTDPNVVLLLLGIGVQAILIELSSPGGWVSGFIGAVCLALATYGLGVLPVNWLGLIFIVIAFVLFILDINAPTHGALTAAGVGSFIAGALILFNSPASPEFLRVSPWLVVTMGIFLGAGFAVVLHFAIRAQKAPVQVGMTALPGQHGIAQITFKAGHGQVLLNAELWSAEATADSAPIRKGDRVEVVAIEGLRLKVRKAHDKGTR